MQENNSQKIFTGRAISVATFFGGPIAAGFLISKNFKVFGNERAALNSIFIGLLSSVLLFTGIFLSPDYIIDKIPEFLIPGIYTMVIALLVEKLQGQKIQEFLASNGQKASNWQVAGYGMAGLFITAAYIFVVIGYTPSPSYKKSIVIESNVVLHYTKEVGDLESKEIAFLFKETGFFNGTESADLLLAKEENLYSLLFVLPNPSILSDEGVINMFTRFENYMNDHLNFENKIEIGFIDVNMQTRYELQKTAIDSKLECAPLLDLLAYQVNRYHTIYYNSSMPLSDVKKMEDAIMRLKSYFPQNQSLDIIFINSDPDYTIKFFVDKDQWKNNEIVKRLRSTVEYIKSNGINKNINLVLIDNQTFDEEEI